MRKFRKSINKSFVNNICSPVERFKYQDRKDDIYYRFTDDINKIDSILLDKYQDNVVLPIEI